jgi:hypothetical protein
MSEDEWITFTVVDALVRRALPAASRITDSNAAKRTKHILIRHESNICSSKY